MNAVRILTQSQHGLLCWQVPDWRPSQGEDTERKRSSDGYSNPLLSTHQSFLDEGLTVTFIPLGLGPEQMDQSQTSHPKKKKGQK
jgi:hypothetical protein